MRVSGGDTLREHDVQQLLVSLHKSIVLVLVVYVRVEYVIKQVEQLVQCCGLFDGPFSFSLHPLFCFAVPRLALSFKQIV